MRLSAQFRVLGLGIFLFTTASRTALGPTQAPIQWVTGSLSLEVKRPGREADHSHTSSAEVKNAFSYTSTPPVRLHGVIVKLSLSVDGHLPDGFCSWKLNRKATASGLIKL